MHSTKTQHSRGWNQRTAARVEVARGRISKVDILQSTAERGWPEQARAICSGRRNEHVWCSGCSAENNIIDIIETAKKAKGKKNREPNEAFFFLKRKNGGYATTTAGDVVIDGGSALTRPTTTALSKEY